MTDTRSSVPGFILTATCLALCVALPSLGLPLFYVQQAFLLFFFAALAQSWNILGGYAGYLSFGHVAFVGLGGYTVGILFYKLGWSPFYTFPLAGVTSVVLALIIGAICFRIRGSYFLIATMLVLFILQSLALNLRDLTQASRTESTCRCSPTISVSRRGFGITAGSARSR